MKSIGFNRPLYVLPFDHRASFETKMFGLEGPPTPEETARIAAAKQVIYDGFLAALEGGVPDGKACVLVDEQFGAAILRDAAAHGHAFACPVEKSGQDEFDFEYGDDFAQHIEAFRPTFSKVLVRYNPEGDPDVNKRSWPPEATLRLPARREQQRAALRAAGPARERAAGPVRRRQEGLRPEPPAGAHDPGHPADPERARRARHLEGRGARPTRGLRADRGDRASGRARRRSAVSSWAAEPTTRRSGDG